jgi:hypothetical protein
MRNISKIAKEIIIAVSTISDEDFLATFKEFSKKHKGEDPGIEADKKITKMRDFVNDKFMDVQRYYAQIGFGSMSYFFDTYSTGKKGWHTSADKTRGDKVFKNSKDLMSWLETFYKLRSKG